MVKNYDVFRDFSDCYADGDSASDHLLQPEPGSNLNVTNKRRYQHRKINYIFFGFLIISCLYVGFFHLLMKLNSYKPLQSLNVHLSGSKGSLAFIKNKVEERFLVYSPNCKIPAIDPFAIDVMKIFRHERYETCSSREATTRIEMNWNSSDAMLIFNYKPKWYLSFSRWICCYSEISRFGVGRWADDKFKLSSCIKFTKSFKLPAHVEFIIVNCKSMGKTVYNNTHAIIRERLDIRQNLNKFKKIHKNHRPLSVLMISIDSVSRLNMIRAMPKTFHHLHDSGWFEMQGYNKIDFNTFPNLMAILTGYNGSLATSKCDPKLVGGLDKCRFIWDDFKESGYVTSYGEDEASISSFNYRKRGFLKQPTDYYLRPYMLAAEKYLPKKTKSLLKFCLGNKHSADHIYDFAMDFATHYKNDASFGLYWTNTFSHNDLSDTSSMDYKMRDYLDTLKTRGILNESMVVFFSDHGMSRGPVSHLISGWFEQRLPFMFIWLPEWFQKKHPEIVQALKINRNRLTNPYDMHMTLKHVLQMSNPDKVYAPATSCKNCQSLFTEIPWNRSCNDSSIPDFYCTCTSYQLCDKDSDIIKNAVKLVMDDMNHRLQKYTNYSQRHSHCSELHLKNITEARIAEYSGRKNHDYNDYFIKFQVSPSNAWFESSVRYQPGINEFEVSKSISRLNSYGHEADCMENDSLRLFCYCIKE